MINIYIYISDQIRSVAQSCLTLCDLMDYSLLGSCVHGIFQARVLGCHCLLKRLGQVVSNVTAIPKDQCWNT